MIKKVISLIFRIAVNYTCNYLHINETNKSWKLKFLRLNERDLKKKQKLSTIIPKGLLSITLFSAFILHQINLFFGILYYKVAAFHSISNFGSSLTTWKVKAIYIKKKILFINHPVYSDIYLPVEKACLFKCVQSWLPSACKLKHKIEKSSIDL